MILISVEQNGFVTYLKTDKSFWDILNVCKCKTPYKALKDIATEFLSVSDFAFENQFQNLLAVEFNFDENTLTLCNDDIYMSCTLDNFVKG